MGVFGGQGFTLCFNPVKIAKRSFVSIVSTDSSIFWWQPRLRAATCDVSMQMDRRAAAGIIFAAPAAAFASSGDSPKQSYFGASPMSAPFGETYTARGNDSLFVKMDETEREIFARIAKQSKEQLTNVRTAAACAHAMSARAGNMDYWPSSAPCCPFQHTDLLMVHATDCGLHCEEGLGPLAHRPPSVHVRDA